MKSFLAIIFGFLSACATQYPDGVRQGIPAGVSQSNAVSVTIFGHVTRSAVYKVPRSTSLFALLLTAGGLAPGYERASMVEILRKTPSGTKLVARISYKDIRWSKQVSLRDGDYVRISAFPNFAFWW